MPFYRASGSLIRRRARKLSRVALRKLIVCAIALLGAAATWAISQTHFFQIVELKAVDLHFLVRGAVPVHGIQLIVVDQKSLDKIPDLQMFWHPYYAEAIRAAAAGGAKVFGMDVAFSVPVQKWEPSHDQALAEAVASTVATMPVICAYVPSMLEKQAEWPVPVNIVASALNLSGFVNLTVDSDDFVREQELMEADEGGQRRAPVRSMAIRVAEKFTGSEAVWKSGILSLAGGAIPLDNARKLRINYAGPAGTLPRVSLWDFLTAARTGNTRQIEEWVKGKAVFLGLDGLDDRYPTPFFTPLHPRSSTAGVEIHGNTVHTLLDRDFLVAAPPAWQVFTLLAFSLVASATAGWLRPRSAALSLTGLLILTAVAVHLAFRAGVLFPNLAFPFTAVLCVIGSATYRFSTAEKRSALFHRAITVFVGKKTAKSIEDARSLSGTGVRQVVTILFSDIRGFTAFCEDKDPVLVIDLLNEYFGIMVSVIVTHGGNVNKFIGDGILAIFSDDDGPGLDDHALRAVRCGVQMTRARLRFETGIGIHTGPVVIGNVGSMEKLEYTALGDTVNLASRLESLNKEQNTRILISDATWQRLPGEYPAKPVGSVHIRGKTLPMQLYTVLERDPAVANRL